MTAKGGSYAQQLIGDWVIAGVLPPVPRLDSRRFHRKHFNIIVGSVEDDETGPVLQISEEEACPLKYRPDDPDKPDKLSSYDWWMAQIDPIDDSETWRLFFGLKDSYGKIPMVVQVLGKSGGLYVDELLMMTQAHTWEGKQTDEEREWMQRISKIVEPGGQPHSMPTDHVEANTILPSLCLGSATHAHYLQSAAGTGIKITAVINAAAGRNECRIDDGIKRLDIDLEDDSSGDCNAEEFFTRVFAILESVEREGGKALVHCHMGRNRSALLVAAYLIKSKRWPLLRAVDHCFTCRPGILGNWHFRHQLIRLAKQEELLGPTEGPFVGEVMGHDDEGKPLRVVGYNDKGEPRCADISSPGTTPVAKRSRVEAPDVREVLERILDKQNKGYWGGTYQEALQEITEGRKRGCWIWWIWPHLRELRLHGQHPELKLKNIQAHRDYLRHDVLRRRLLEITQATRASGETVNAIFGSLDADKFREAITCFSVAAAAEHDFEALTLFIQTLGWSGGYEPRAAQEIARQAAGDDEMEGYGLYVAKVGAIGDDLLKMSQEVSDGRKSLSAAAEDLEPQEHKEAFAVKTRIEVLNVEGAPRELVGKTGTVSAVDGGRVQVSIGGQVDSPWLERGMLLWLPPEVSYGYSNYSVSRRVSYSTPTKSPSRVLYDQSPSGKPRVPINENCELPCDGFILEEARLRKDVSLHSQEINRLKAGTKVKVLKFETLAGGLKRALVDAGLEEAEEKGKGWVSVVRGGAVLLSETMD